MKKYTIRTFFENFLLTFIVSIFYFNISAANAREATPISSGLGIFDEKRALATGGLSSLEGASGGGLASWATIGGYGSDKGLGTAVHYSYIHLTDYQDQNVGALLGLYNRIEISYTHNFFQTQSTGTKLGVGKNYTLDLDIVGLKARLFGDLASPGLLPQVAIGAMYKHTGDHRVMNAIGTKSNNGVDAYIAATKIFSKFHIILNTTLRFTKANQIGILGFGGNKYNKYSPEFEGSIGFMPPFIPGLIVGGEYRTKPNSLHYISEDNWFDIYGTYFLNKHFNLTVAFVSLGTLATFRHQRGVYAAIQTGF